MRPAAFITGFVLALGIASPLRAQEASALRASSATGRIEIADLEYGAYVGSTVHASAVVWQTGVTVNDSRNRLRWHSSDLEKAWITDDGTLSLFLPGTVTLTATQGDLKATRTITIVENPAAKVKLSGEPRAEVRVGTPIRFNTRVTDKAGVAVTDAHVNYGVALGDVVRDPRVAQITDDGVLTVSEPGVYMVVAEFGGVADHITMLIGMPGITVVPAAEEIQDMKIIGGDYSAFVGTTIPLSAKVLPRGSKSPLPTPRMHWASSDEDVAWVGQNGVVVFTGPGRVTITGDHGKHSAYKTFDVERNPAARLVMLTNVREIFVSDTVALRTETWARGGQLVRNPRINYAVIARTSDTPGGATVLEGGRFVAKTPGVYTIVAEFGGLSDTRTIMVQPPRAPVASKASRRRD